MKPPNEEGRPHGGQPQQQHHTAPEHIGSGRRCIPWLEDLHTRAIRILEAFEDGDYGFVQIALEDLADDLWQIVKAEDRWAA
jgi:hypothetical protein